MLLLGLDDMNIRGSQVWIAYKYLYRFILLKPEVNERIEVGDTQADDISLTIDTFTTNGFKVTGGEYTIKNSTIVCNVNAEVDPNDAGGYCAGVTSGLLTLDHVSFTTNGKGGRGGNYTVDCEGDGTMVVISSEIIQTGLSGDPEEYTVAIADPPSNAALSISGYARANMSIGHSQTYYYGSYVETEGWAAMSTDSASGSGLDFYSYNSEAYAISGGYGIYAGEELVLESAGTIEVTGTVRAGSGITIPDTHAIITPEGGRIVQITPESGDPYYTVTESDGSTAASHVVIEGSELKITAQPEDFTGATGQKATFTVEVEGNGLTYQWQYLNVGTTKW